MNSLRDILYFQNVSEQSVKYLVSY